jgi:hypothetical protein
MIKINTVFSSTNTLIYLHNTFFKFSIGIWKLTSEDKVNLPLFSLLQLLNRTLKGNVINFMQKHRT